MADEGGLSDIDIAQFFGRKTIAQGAIYKHGTVAQRAESFKELIRGGKVHGHIPRVASALGGAELDKFLDAAIGIVHVTPVGVCVHDFAALPCQNHHVCFRGCREFMRVRNDTSSRDVLLNLRRREAAALESSKLLLAAEYGGENEFVAKAIETSEKNIVGIDAALSIDTTEPDTSTSDAQKPVRIFPDSSSSLMPIS